MDNLFIDLAALAAAALTAFIAYKLLAKLFGRALYKTVTEDGVTIKYSKLLRRAIIKNVVWSGDCDAEYIFPESYKGCKVVRLGDSGGFGVTLSSPQIDWQDGYSFRQAHVKNDELTEYELKFFLGRYIREISKCTMLFGHISDLSDEPKPLARVRYTFTVDERNENFCTKKGRLYYWDGSRIEETTAQ